MSSVLSFRKPSSNLELYLPDTCIVICIIHVLGFGLSLGLWCLTPLPTIFQLPVYTCKVLDDEIHFFLQCQINNNLRNVLINNIKKYKCIMLISTNWTLFSQVKIILIPDQECLLSVVDYIKQSLELRK